MGEINCLKKALNIKNINTKPGEKTRTPPSVSYKSQTSNSYKANIFNICFT